MSPLTATRARTPCSSSAPLAKPLRTTISACALLLALATTIGGTCLLLAGITSYQADTFLNDWTKKGEEPNERAWQDARDAAQHAIDLYPVTNGAYLQRLGLIYQWQQFRLPLGAPEAVTSRRAALEAFRAATASRPTWPGNWTDLAYAKVYLLEFDTEFHAALQRAQELGPWRIDINRRIAEIGFIAWSELNATEREIILQSARRTATYSPQEAQNLLAFAEQAGRTSELCASLSPELKTARKICL